MRRSIATLTVIISLSSVAAPLEAVTPIAPFSGAFSEGFESFVFGGLPGTDPTQAGPFCVLDNVATLSARGGVSGSPIFIWGGSGGFSLGEHGTAVPFDGEKGLGLQSFIDTDSTARLDFRAPVSEFGGYWVHAATAERAGSVTVRFFDASNELITTEEVNYDGSLDGASQWFGWSNETPFQSVEFTGFWLGLDGVQVNTAEAPVEDAVCNDFGSPTILDTDTTIDANHSFPIGGIEVIDGAIPTTVQLVDGGRVATDYPSPSHIRGTSQWNIAGGVIGSEVNVHDRASIHVTGGDFITIDPYYPRVRVSPPPTEVAAIIARDASTVSVTDGQFQVLNSPAVLVTDHAQLSISGGELFGFFEPTVVVRGQGTVNILDNAKVLSSDVGPLVARESSTVNIQGGEINGEGPLRAFGESLVHITNGSVDGDEGGVYLSDRSQFVLSGGVVGSDGVGVVVGDQSILKLAGAEIRSGSATVVHVTDSGQAHIASGRLESGDFGGIVVVDQGLVNLWGGDVEGDDNGLSISGSAVANIWGGQISGDDGRAGLFAAGNAVVNLRGGVVTGDDPEIDVLVSGTAVVNVFGRDLTLTDSMLSGTFADGSEFEWMYAITDDGSIVFHELTDLACDIDDDGACGVEDINSLTQAIEAEGHHVVLDLNEDGVVDSQDRDDWLVLAAVENGFGMAYLAGDANLDGTVDTKDLNVMALNWQRAGKTWSAGNFSLDSSPEFGNVDVVDLNALAANWRKSVPRQPDAVPEPSGWILAIGSFILFALRYRIVAAAALFNSRAGVSLGN